MVLGQGVLVKEYRLSFKQMQQSNEAAVRLPRASLGWDLVPRYIVSKHEQPRRQQFAC